MGRSKKRRLSHHITTDSERWRVELLAEWGMYGRTIAGRVYGCRCDPKSGTCKHISRVYTICAAAKVKLVDYRRGENDNAKFILKNTTTTAAVEPRAMRRKQFSQIGSFT